MFVSKCGCNEISLRPLFYFVLPSPTQRMSKYIKEIMKEYKEGIEKIDNAYKVEKVEKIDLSEINKKIEYEKHFIEVLESEAKEENKVIIERAKERLEEAKESLGCECGSCCACH